MRSRPAHLGFTLIEILVAVTLMGIVVSIVYASMAATTRSVRAYRERLSVSTRGHLALQQITATLRCCYKELRTQDSGLRIRSTKPIVDDHSGQKGAFEVALRFDRTSGTIMVSQEPWQPGISKDRVLQAWHPLIDHVTDVQWSFWDGTTWKQDWDLEMHKDLPLLVRMDLRLHDAHSRQYDLQTQVSPSCGTKAVTATMDANGPAKL